MMWFKKWPKRIRITTLALVVLVLTFSATGVVAASTGEFNSISEKMQLRAERIAAAVESGKLTQAEADEKLAALKAKVGDGKKQGKMKKGHRGGPGALAKRIAAAVESGKLTQAEADSIWDKLNVATMQ